MITENLHGFVLHKKNKGETSLYVTVFTREEGLITALYKGGRTPRKNSTLQLFTPLWLTFNRKIESRFLQLAEPLSPSLFLNGTNLFAGLYLTELLYRTLHPQDPYPNLFDAYALALHQLTTVAQRNPMEAVLRQFEKKLLSECGYLSSLTMDIHTDPILPNQQYAMLPGEGFIKAKTGILGTHLILFAQNKLDDEGVLKSAKWIMRHTIDYVLEGKAIQTRALFGTLYKNH